MLNKISFVTNRPWLNPLSKSKPEPTVKFMPDWFRNADRFVRDHNGEFYVGPDGGKYPTWKACPALFDIMSTGYMLKTPCDLEFYKDSSGRTNVKISDPYYQDFCTKREAMHQFVTPYGYDDDHFAWFADWAVKVPEGYSVLYTQPFNRYDLPFITTNGIIDNDVVSFPGTMPFFLNKDFVGVLPAETPFVQIFPFKREDWEAEYIYEDTSLMHKKNAENSMKFRIPNGGFYKNNLWHKRNYK